MLSNKYCDIKYTIWQRVHFKEDTDMDKIIELAKENIEQIFDEELGFEENETLFDTASTLSPEQNEGDSTIELFDLSRNENNSIWKNGK